MEPFKVDWFSKKRSLEQIRSLIRSAGPCHVEKGSPFHDTLVTLLERHPDGHRKIGTGIEHFEIKQNKLGAGLCVAVHRTDGSCVDVSVVKCITGKADDPKKKLLISMRTAVTDQVLEYRRGAFCPGFSLCSRCGQPLENGSFDVDHKDPPFQSLADAFLRDYNGTIPTEFDKDGDTNMSVFRTEEKEFTDRWVMFHGNNSTFQLLCKACNVSKSNR